MTKEKPQTFSLCLVVNNQFDPWFFKPPENLSGKYEITQTDVDWGDTSSVRMVVCDDLPVQDCATLVKAFAAQEQAVVNEWGSYCPDLAGDLRFKALTMETEAKHRKEKVAGEGEYIDAVANCLRLDAKDCNM
ncbi:MAG: hypothetical protein H6860_04570 [Rhodospirillales bacterium]|nr:hypothetical protein [Alphaproteobacteria bacterium]MCB9981655.1 hypothetical protein [Rhodospirillales bacterium]